MQVSEKQDSVAQAVADGKTEILLEGALGTSKTYCAALLLLGIAIDYPGSRIFVGRRHLTEMRTSTLPSFDEAATDMGLIADETYKLIGGSSPQMRVHNGPGKATSTIFFIGLDHIKDKQFAKIKGLNATCTYIDEVDGVVELGFTTLASRAGRANKNGAPAFALASCNANDGWVKRRWYDKHKDPEKNGRLPSNVAVIEFDVSDSWLGDTYYQQFENNPLQWKRRFLFNDWGYGDDTGSLFKYRFMDSIHVFSYQRGKKTIGYDVARQGNDRSVCSLWDNGVLVDIVIVKDHDEQKDGGEQAKWLHDYAIENGVGYEDIIVDGVGNGVTVIDNLKTLYGWKVTPFIAGGVPEAKLRQQKRKKQFEDTVVEPLMYNNLRSEQTYLLAAAIEKGDDVYFYDGCPYLSDFKKEATLHEQKISSDRQLVIESKDKVKERSGQSPDVFDAVMMGYYKHKNTKPVGTYGTRNPAADNRVPGAKTHMSTKGRAITHGLMRKKF